MGICCDASGRTCRNESQIALRRMRSPYWNAFAPPHRRIAFRNLKKSAVSPSEYMTFCGVEHAQREARPHGRTEIERHPADFFAPLRNVVRHDPARADVAKSFQRTQHLVNAGNI